MHIRTQLFSHHVELVMEICQCRCTRLRRFRTMGWWHRATARCDSISVCMGYYFIRLLIIIMIKTDYRHSFGSDSKLLAPFTHLATPAILHIVVGSVFFLVSAAHRARRLIYKSFPLHNRLSLFFHFVRSDCRIALNHFSCATVFARILLANAVCFLCCTLDQEATVN